MAQTNTSIYGRYTNRRGQGNIWHELHQSTPGYDGLIADGTVYITRDVESSLSCRVTGSLSSTLHNDSGYATYGYVVSWALIRGGSQTPTRNAVDTSNIAIQNGTILRQGTLNGTANASTNLDFSIDDDGNTLYVCFLCGETNGCSLGYLGGSHSDWIIVGTINTPPYNPYKQPTIGISTTYNISRHDTQRGMWIYGNTSGDNTDTDTWVIVNGNRDDWDIGNSGGTYEFYPNQKGVSDGVSYSFKAYRQHTQRRDWIASASTTLYTYRTPILNTVNLSNTNFSGFGNVTLNWRTNARRWNTNPTENAFQTYIKFGTDNKWFLSSNSNPTGPSQSNETSPQSQTITKSIINSHFSEEQRCQQVVDTTIQVRRTNPSSQVNVDSSALSISVQFAPKYKPNQINYWDYNSSSSNNRGNSINPGSTCYLDEHPQIVIDWSIPNNIDRGVIDGYELYIYNDNSYTDKYKTFTVNVGDSNGLVTDLYGQKVVNIRTDLVRGQMNYVGVRAFYINPRGQKMYGPELQKQFILPIGKLYKPVISYPVNNSQWHNKNFRILFELPQDDDYDVLDEYIQNDTYEYKEIVVVINNTEYKYSENSNIFSINKMGYKYKVCVNPSIISSFIDTDIYRLTVRVQKNYFVNVWSETSNTTILNKLPVNRQNLQKDMLVMGTHYKYVQRASIRLYNTYPINILPTDNVDQNKGNIIYAKHYQAIFDTILNIQDGVNNWARYDTGKGKCKFQQTIDKFSGTNKATTDIITSQDDERPTRQGRNYFNILIECMNKLY